MIKYFTTTARQRKELVLEAKKWIDILLDDDHMPTGDDSVWYNPETNSFYIGMAAFWMEDADPQSFNLCQIIDKNETADDLTLQVINNLIRFNGYKYSTKKNFYEAFQEVEEDDLKEDFLIF